MDCSVMYSVAGEGLGMVLGGSQAPAQLFIACT